MTSILTKLNGAGPKGEQVFTITPEDARMLLKFNTHNRAIADNEVLKWACEMESGRWQYNGDPVRLATDDGLAILDGQHRLSAVAMQADDFRIKMLFVWGLPAESQLTMDQGRRRGVADQLTLAGYAMNSSEAAGLRLYIYWSEDYLFTNANEAKRRVTTTYLYDWVDRNPDVLDLIREGFKYIHSGGDRIECSPRVTVAAFAAISTRATKAPLGCVAEFFGGVLHGADLPPDSPILALRSRLRGMATKKTRMTDRDLLGMFFNTYNHWRKDEGITRIQMPNGSSFTAKNFPKVTQV